MISKRVEILENNLEREYSYIYLFIGESERMVTREINEFCKTWYGEIVDVDLENQSIDFGDVSIDWFISDCSKEKFIEELLGDRIRMVK